VRYSSFGRIDKRNTVNLTRTWHLQTQITALTILVTHGSSALGDTYYASKVRSGYAHSAPLMSNETAGESLEWQQLRTGNPTKTFPAESATEFGDDILIHTRNSYKVVDLLTLRLKPLSFKKWGNVFSVCANGDGAKYALRSTTGGSQIKLEAQGLESEIAIPEEVASTPGDWRILADGSELALVGAQRIYVHRDKEWRSVDIEKRAATLGESDKLMMKSGKIYCASSHGEWGGFLNEIDATTGSIKKVYQGLPVNDIKFDRSGKLWFVVGVSHLSMQSAGLFSYDGVQLKCHSEVEGFQDFSKPGTMKVTKQSNFSLQPTDFQGLAFAKDGSILVASTNHGVLRYKDEQWQQVTKDWPGFVMLCGFVLLDYQLAVLPVYDRGVAIYDMKASTYRFILP
jgi:hypothetical protein